MLCEGGAGDGGGVDAKICGARYPELCAESFSPSLFISRYQAKAVSLTSGISKRCVSCTLMDVSYNYSKERRHGTVVPSMSTNNRTDWTTSECND